MKAFKAPRQSLGTLDAEAMAKVIGTAADIALVLDVEGVIRDLSLRSDEVALQDDAKWIGRAWVDTVTVESRPKVEALLSDAVAPGGTGRSRQLNHPSPAGDDVPVLYSTIKLGKKGPILALGRDLRSVSALQKRLLDAQQGMEREYSRLRHAETRYRLLFQMATEAVLVLDAASQKVIEANPVALKMLGDSSKRVAGRPFPQGLDAASSRNVQNMLATLRTAGEADDVIVRTADGKQRYTLSASVFRHESATFFLVRLAALSGQPKTSAVVTPTRSRVLEVVDHLPDGFVVTDLDGNLLTANAAFLDVAQLGTEEQARGENLARWLGRTDVDFDVLMSNLKAHGSVRLFASVVRGQYGTATDVEISAVAVPQGEHPSLGFSIRPISPRRTAESKNALELPHSVEQLTELIGRVPLKDLVRDTTDVIERMCIEAALQLTGDNRASAAEMLGLSRQSLYVKLRRYGLSDANDEAEAGSSA